MTRQHSLRSQQHKPRRVYMTNGERFELEFEFYKQMIQGFLNASDDYVGPFLKPVDPNEAPDYYLTIKSPIDLATILQQLEDGKYKYYGQIEKCFNCMFRNCFRYNDSDSEVYRLGKEFQVAFKTALDGKDEWIQAEATKTYQTRRVSTDHDADDITEDGSNASSNKGDTENLNTSPEDTRDDDETTDEELPTKRIRRRPYVLQTDDSDEDAPPKRPVLKNRARKTRIRKLPFSCSNAASFLNANNKRPLDTTSATATSSPPSPHQQNPVLEQPAEEQTITSTQDHEVSTEQGPAKRPRLEPSAESPSESPVQTPTQQQGTQQPAIQQPAREPHQPTPEESLRERFRAILSDVVMGQIAAHMNRINTNEDGEFDQYLYIWNLLCRNEQRLEFEQAWRVKAMQKVGPIQLNNITDLAVEGHVRSAFKETVLERWDRVRKEMDGDATALSRRFDRDVGDTGHA